MVNDIRIPESLPSLPATFHFIGIGGIGMSGLARILKMWGYQVSGSDIADSAQTVALRQMGIPVVIGHHDPTLAAEADILVTNKRAAANAHVEIDAGIANGARIVRRGDLLGMAAGERFSIAVAGSHGKSTTSGMLSVALRTLEVDPTFAVGAIVAATGTNAEPGQGPHFVVEADEFDRSFHGLFPNVAIITSVSFDHPDIYNGPQEYDQAFIEFIANIQPNGTVIIAGDDAGSQRIIAALSELNRPDLIVQTFGESDHCDWKLRGDAAQRLLIDPANQEHVLTLRLPGRHNARNGVAAIAALHAADFSVAEAVRGVDSFTGIGRRFEYKGRINDVDVIDDYAHHPDEIAAVVQAVRDHYVGKRIIAVHQPHTFTRTYSLMDEFAAALDLADDVVLMDIYGVGEVNEHSISSRDLASKMDSEPNLVTTLEEAANAVRSLLGNDNNAIVLTLGAGPVTEVGPLLVTTSP